MRLHSEKKSKSMRHLNIQASDKGKLPMTWEEKSKMYKKPNRVFEGGDGQQ